jgi:hypothetical protein
MIYSPKVLRNIDNVPYIVTGHNNYFRILHKARSTLSVVG